MEALGGGSVSYERGTPVRAMQERDRAFGRQRQDIFFFFFTLVTGPRRSLSLKLSDTRVYEQRQDTHPAVRALAQSISVYF